MPLAEQLARVLQRDSDVLLAYLFGSEGRGDAGKGSDIDVGVLLASGAPKTLEALPGRLARELESVACRAVDLVVLNAASPDLLHRVLRDGQVLFERSRSERIHFEMDARRRYFDLKPHLDRYRRGST